MKKKWNLYSISKSRTIIMGFAALIVALFHCRLKSGVYFFNYILKTGNVGVDVFLFVSAIGLYFSFTKNSNIKDFYKKRLLRIAPSIFIVGTIYYLYRGASLLKYLASITLMALFINGNRDLWYFSLIIILYFLYPFLYKVIKKYGLMGLISMLLFVIGFTILLFSINYTIYSRIEIALTRIPVFLIGIYVGKSVFEKKEINKLFIIPFILVFILVNTILYSGNIKQLIIARYLYCFLGTSIVFIISFFRSLWSNRFIDKFLSFFGLYSMEIYLIFEHLSLEVKKIVTIYNSILFYLSMFIITIILSILLKKLCDFIVKKIEGYSNKSK